MNRIILAPKGLICFLFFLLVQTIGFGATITSTGTGGNWNTTSSWAGGVVPTATDDIVIVNGATITVSANAFVNNVTIQSGGVLTIPNNIILTINGSIVVNSGGQFNAGTGNNDSAIIKVFGNFTNQGTSNFWKSTVVIKGNLATSSTILHNNGNIIVGGNVTATLSGGGNGYVYPVSPNATVSVTGTSHAQPAGTQPTNQTLIDLMNEVIYGGPCSPSIALSSINASPACKSNNQTTVTITSTSASMLPVGTYTVTYDFYNNGNNLTASMIVSTAGTGVFIANASVVNATSSTNLRIKKIASSSCYSDISSNNYSNNFYMYPILTAPTVSSGSYQCDRKWLAQWTPDATLDGYYLDVATDASFTNFFAGYQDKYIAGGSTQSEVIANLAYGGIYYYRLRAKSYCGTSANSNTITININGNNSSNPGTIGGGASSICVGSTTTFTKDLNSWPSTGDWSIFNQTGSATITAGGVVTGVSPGTVLVVFTTQNGGCGTSTRRTLTITGGTIGNASSSQTPCINTLMTNITHTTSGFTGISNSGVSGANGLPAGVSASFASNVVTISGTPTVSGIFNYTIPLTGGSCGNANATGTITVAASPTIASISVPAGLCSGSSFNPAVPTVTANGSAISSQGWQISTTSGGSTYTTLTLPYTVAFADNGKNIRYMATNGCGTTNSNVVVLAVNAVPTITSISSPSALCSGSSFNPAVPTVTVNGSAISSQGWQISTTSGGITYTALTVPYTVAFADNGKNIRYTATNSCGTTNSNVVALTVKSDSGIVSLNSTPVPSGSTTCSELTTATFSIAPIAGATGYVWSVPTGWKTEGGVAITAPVITAAPELKVITGSSTDNGNVTVTADNLFCPSSLFVTLTSIAPPTPTPNAVIPVRCSTLGSVSFNNLPVGNWTLNVIKNAISSSITGTGSSFTLGSLTSGNYTFTVTNAYGTSASVLVTVEEVTKTWKGSGWFIGTTPTTVVPTLDDIAVFEADYNGTDSINACSCTVKAGVNVTIATGKVLTVENGLNVQGTLMFKDGASLIQNNESIVNTDNIIYERKTSAVKDFDYVYWSSPVAGQTLGALSPQSDKYWSWFGNYWTAETGSSAMTQGKGYIARVPRYVTSQTVNFIGPPNNGDVSIATQGILKSNLIGNPYPSAIDAELFMIDNAPLFLETGAMLYFWTHFAARDLNGAGTEYVYKTEDYAYFNLTGGTGAELGRPVPDGTIAAGQSFMVGSEIGGFFTFNNSMRIGENDKNSHFFKQANTKKTAKIEKNRIWLNFANSGGAYKQLLVGYITGATNDADKLFDGVSLNGNAYVDFYSVMNSKKYTIQGRKLPFDETDEVPLGYNTTIEGTFQISIDKTDGFLTNQTVYLEDKTANVIHDLKKGSYSFTTAKGDFKDRFVLRYTNTSKLGTGDFDPKGKGVIVSVNNSQIKINSFDKALSSVKVYDLKGSLLYEKNKVDGNEFVINHLALTTQFMVVMVQLEDGKWVSEEIIFHD